MHLRSKLSMSLVVAFVALAVGSFIESQTKLTSPAQGPTAASSAPALSSVQAQAPSPVKAARLSASYGKLPISFEVNRGQTDKTVQFLARSAGYMLFLTPGEAVLSLHAAPPAKKPGIAAPPKPVPATPSDIVRMQLIGANLKADATGLDPLPGKSNYFIGNDPANWHTDVPTFAKVRYSGVYPGIDLVYYGNQEGRLEHDFVVAPGSDPHAISIGLPGSRQASPDHSGGLIIHTDNGDLALRRPVAYQTIDGRRQTISAEYVLDADNKIDFQLGSYDRTATLVIDPVVVFTGAWGGSTQESPQGVAVDSSGSAYVAGFTYSTDYPVVDPLQSKWTPTSSQSTTAFVTKLNASGTALVYSTYLGGPATSSGPIAVDNAGNAYVAGMTGNGFPVKNAYQSTYGGNNSDAFLSVLSPEGNSLVFSTYLGGPTGDWADAVALDDSGNVYVTGETGGSFPILHSIQASGGAFVAKFTSAGTLVYSSVFGGPASLSYALQPFSIAVDASGYAYIGGPAYQNALLPTAKAFQSKCNTAIGSGTTCGFVVKVDPSGDSLAYSTYLGQATYVSSIAVDSSGDVYAAGASEAGGFPVSKTAFQRTFAGGGNDGLVAKLNATGTGLVWATYLGGKGWDQITSMAIDQHRTVYVTGYTCSSNFPLMASLEAYPGTSDLPCAYFVSTLDGSLSTLDYYSTYFGPAFAGAWGYLAVDKAQNVYLTGGNGHEVVPPTPGAVSIGGKDVFLSKLTIMDDISTALSASSSTAYQGGNLTYTIAVTSKGPDYGWNVLMTDDLPAGTTFVNYSASGGTCTAPAVGATGTLNCELLQLNKGDTWTVTLTVNVNATPGTVLSNTAAANSNMQDFYPANNTATLTTPVGASIEAKH